RDIDVEQLVLEGEDYQPQDIFYWKLDETSLQNTISKLRSHLELEDSEEDLTESEVLKMMIKLIQKKQMSNNLKVKLIKKNNLLNNIKTLKKKIIKRMTYTIKIKGYSIN